MRGKKRIERKKMTRISESIFAQPKEESTEIFLFYNNTGDDIPAGSMMEIDGVTVADGIFQVKRPTGDDLENIVVNGDTVVVAGGFGQGWESGTHPVEFNGVAPVATERIGSQNASWVAKKSDSGTHLVRAVSGSTAFAYPFRVSGITLNRVYFDEVCYVDSANANTNYGYPTNSLCRWDHTGWRFRYGVCHFASRISAPAPPSNNQIMLVLPEFTNFTNGIRSLNTTSGNNVGATLKVQGIEEDFDPSTLTYNDYIALTKAQAGVHPLIAYLSDNTVHYAAANGAIGGAGSTPALSQSNSLASFNFRAEILENQSYGVSFEIVPTGSSANGSYTEMDLTARSLGSGSAKYGWVEWWL